MTVSMSSREKVKPRPLESKGDMGGEVEGELRRPPFKLCFLDQVIPPNYTSLVLFYPMAKITTTDEYWSPESMSNNLKESLSHTLNSFYPLSGRVKDNIIVDDFEAGVPFIGSRVQGHRMSEFLHPPKLDLLNKLFPVEPFCRHTEPGQLPPPQVTVQMNTFDCGGVAIGLCFYHQTMDAATTSTFLNTWAAHSRQLITPDSAKKEVEHVSAKDLSGGYSTFPPPTSGVGVPPHELASLMDRLWFPPEKNTVATTRRFVIRNHAIATLKSRATAAGISNPTRNEVILAFIWKSMVAAAAASESPKPLCLRQAVNLRSRMKKKKNNKDDLILSQHSIGNLYSMSQSFFCDDDPANDGEMDNPNSIQIGAYSHLVGLIREGMTRLLDDKCLNLLSSDRGPEMFFQGMKHLQSAVVPSVSFSSWIGFGFSDLDFGWGTPVWSGVVGEASGNNPVLTNIFVLKELAPKDDEEVYNGVEVWMRVDPILMASLEKNAHFLEIASPNPPIIF
ncbi:unnamed protein product [Linum tenue]|uniref:Uncharacterized protein n=1 Tax=Linum tenue TaxID=586396 RepID=A0AAV0JM90_9ROSI|nr:unnamed protein product [Linum tenue]